MAIRITLECGHASMVRARPTAEGYTHDWEVFVRGVDNADIYQYIEKVVFQLHETFLRPKRVFKEPPFVVKESGYASFNIPIEIHLKNKDEPKKLQIVYDLDIFVNSNVIRHIETINNPSDDFRRKLLRGGANIMTNTEGLSEKGEMKTPTMVGKPKLSGNDSKKHRLSEPKTSNSFADLFGTPIKTAKISPDGKKVTQSEKSSTIKPIVPTEKLERIDKSIKTKDSPHKEKKKEKLDEKKDKKAKDFSKERNRSKEKTKRSSSPGSKSHLSPATKRLPSPTVMKKPVSPIPPSIKASASPKPKEKEIKKPLIDKEREKEKEKVKDNTKNLLDVSKSEKRKDKKHKEDRDRERKEKYKDRDRANSKEALKSSEKKNEKLEKPEKPEKPEKEKSQEYKSTKDGRKSPKPLKESEKIKNDKLVKLEKPEKVEKTEKVKDGKTDKDRQKHKHKKRDKKDKRDSSREREKKEKRDRNKVTMEKESNVPAVPMTTPHSTLSAQLPERDSSDSAPSVDDDSFPEPKPIPILKKEPENTSVSILPAIPMEIKKERSDRKREKPKGSKGEERESRKRKRRSEGKGDEEHLAKREKGRDQSTSPLLEPVSSSQSPVAVDVDPILPIKDKEDRSMAEQILDKGREAEVEQVAPDSTNSTLVESDTGEPPVFSEDYVSQLRELQQKIMTLQDNQELQRVVQVIAETGQYEITKKTFDFDLCALDRRTVQRLQQFFSAS